MPAPSVNSGHTLRENSNTVMMHVIDAPSHSENDAIYFFLLVDGNQTILAPAGFETILSNLAVRTGDHTATVSFFRKVAGGSEPSTYTASTLSGERSVAIAWSQSDDNNVDVSATTSGDGSTVTCPSATTTEADTLILRMVGTDNVTLPHGTATGYTYLAGVERSSGGTVSVQYKVQAAAGATGTEDVSIDSTQEWIGITVAIKGAGSGGGGSTIAPIVFNLFQRR